MTLGRVRATPIFYPKSARAEAVVLYLRILPPGLRVSPESSGSSPVFRDSSLDYYTDISEMLRPDCSWIMLVLFRTRRGDECSRLKEGVGVMFEKAVRRKPLAFAADAVGRWGLNVGGVVTRLTWERQASRPMLRCADDAGWY